MGSGTYSTAASAAAAAGTPTATDPFQAAKGDVEKKDFHINGGMFSPARRRARGNGWKEDDGFFRGDHYCRVRVGRKGDPSDLVEVRGGILCDPSFFVLVLLFWSRSS